MLTENNFADVLKSLNFDEISKNVFQKNFAENVFMKADLNTKKLFYPPQIKNHDKNNFFDKSHRENLVVFECVHRLLEKNYKPEHIEIERAWHLGHDAKSGRADICVSDFDGEKTLFIIECKTFGKEFYKELKNMDADGGQLFSYWQQERACKWLVLYTSTFENEKIIPKVETVDCSDDKNILLAAEKNPAIKTYKNAYTVENLYNVWVDTYEKKFCGDLIFSENARAYEIGIKPLKISDLKEFGESEGIVNKFEEILRHNNVSDKENAFNRLIALFICKLVDETQNTGDSEVSFQYKIGSDSYEILQDRLQRLHRDGMEKFMDEKIFYLPDDYAENLIRQYFGENRENMLEDLQKNLRKLKFYTNNDFAFKDVHNEELFYQNGKVLVEMVRLFQNYKIIGAKDLQTLGDLFEQLLDKGFKQNEGQFFTPLPITRFIWDSLPLEKIITNEKNFEPPKIIDYACGAGHFLTQGFEAINDYFAQKNIEPPPYWEDKKLFGIEKDYRLARVSKISFFMHGADKGSIIFGDGLENNSDRFISPGSFDILVSNPPYSVKGFKPHLKLENKFDVLEKISNDGSEIETLFVERIAQLVKPKGIAAVILPSSILNKDGKSFIAARESILKNFLIRAVVEFGSKTFSATGTKTNVIFLERLEDAPNRFNLLLDSVEWIFRNYLRDDWEDKTIFDAWLKKISVDEKIYTQFILREKNFSDWKDDSYFGEYFAEFNEKIQPPKSLKSDDEKISWLNQKFYDFAHEIEKEKLHYFAMTYTQTTLIISAPEKIEEQKKFLGYEWLTRKKYEGIHHLNMGGLLYDPKNRRAENRLAAAVRKSFSDKQISIPDAEKYFRYLGLSDMISFNGVNFTKRIKTTPPRNMTAEKGKTIYKLSSSNFEISIGNRVLSTEIIAGGKIPVYSANVFKEFGRINKQNITDFSKPSIIWGIDGDWMVNLIPANQPFYPTDHCGVLRVNTEKILPEYLTFVLRVEGEYEKFSRSNRASIERVKSLSVQIPSVEVQKKIVAEFEEVDKKIAEQEKIISDNDENIKNKFAEMFGSIEEKITVGECCEIKRGENLTREEAIAGEIPVVAGGILPSCYHNVANRPKNTITISASGKNAGYVNFWHVPIFATDCNTLHSKNNFSIEFIYYALKDIQDKIFELQKGSAQPHVYGDEIAKISIPNPPKELQEKFAGIVEACEEKKLSAKQAKEKFLSEREELVQKYFR